MITDAYNGALYVPGKQPDKYKVFGVTIHEVEEAMDIRDNKPFDVSEEKFAALEALLKVSLNVFEVTLLPGYVDKGKEQFDLFTCDLVYKGCNKNTTPLSLCILNDLNLPEETPKHFIFIKDLNDFKHRVTRQNDVKNENTARNVRCRFCNDFFGSRKAVHDHEVQAHRELVDESDQYDLSNEETRLRFTNQRYEMAATVVVYADFTHSCH